MPMTSSLNATWIKRFSMHLIDVRPATMPLDAVRHAVNNFPRDSDCDPETAAEAFAASQTPDGAPDSPATAQ